MKNYRPKVYVAMAVDFLHEGHLNILNKASNLGEVTIGLLTDAAISSYKKFPNLSYENRKKLIKNLKFVKNIIPQNTLDYEENLIKLKPDYVVHGADCIMIHSKAQEPKKIFEFSKKFRKTKYFKPLVAVPSTYSKTYEGQLKSNGFQIVIYANHLLRAAYLNMHKTALNILKYNRSFESEKFISSIKDILNLIKND
jgi:cytidyltransferase-like protein